MDKKDLILGVTSFYNNKNEDFSFSTPTHIEYLSSLIIKNDFVLDYGCGYGRLLTELHNRGYTNLFGIDISHTFISRAKSICSKINYKCSDDINSFDNKLNLIIFNNLLVNICFNELQNNLIRAALNKLLINGKIVIIDFLKSNDSRYSLQYKSNLKQYGEDGIYIIDNCFFKHHSKERIEEIKSFFNIIEYQENDVLSLSGNNMRQFILTGSLNG